MKPENVELLRDAEEALNLYWKLVQPDTPLAANCLSNSIRWILRALKDEAELEPAPEKDLGTSAADVVRRFLENLPKESGALKVFDMALYEAREESRAEMRKKAAETTVPSYSDSRTANDLAAEFVVGFRQNLACPDVAPSEYAAVMKRHIAAALMKARQEERKKAAELAWKMQMESFGGGTAIGNAIQEMKP